MDQRPEGQEVKHGAAGDSESDHSDKDPLDVACFQRAWLRRNEAVAEVEISQVGLSSMVWRFDGLTLWRFDMVYSLSNQEFENYV